MFLYIYIYIFIYVSCVCVSVSHIHTPRSYHYFATTFQCFFSVVASLAILHARSYGGTKLFLLFGSRNMPSGGFLRSVAIFKNDSGSPKDLNEQFLTDQTSSRSRKCMIPTYTQTCDQYDFGTDYLVSFERVLHKSWSWLTFTHNTILYIYIYIYRFIFICIYIWMHIYIHVSDPCVT